MNFTKNKLSKKKYTNNYNQLSMQDGMNNMKSFEDNSNKSIYER